MTAVGTRVIVCSIDARVATISGFILGGKRRRVPKSRMRGRGAGRGTVRAKFTIWRAEGTRDMNGGISSGTVAAYAGLPTAEGSVVVIDVTEFEIHKAMENEEGILAMPDVVPSVSKVQARVLTAMECTE